MHVVIHSCGVVIHSCGMVIQPHCCRRERRPRANGRWRMARDHA